MPVTAYNYLAETHRTDGAAPSASENLFDVALPGGIPGQIQFAVIPATRAKGNEPKAIREKIAESGQGYLVRVCGHEFIPIKPRGLCR